MLSDEERTKAEVTQGLLLNSKKVRDIQQARLSINLLLDIYDKQKAEIDRLKAELAEERGKSRYERLPDAKDEKIDSLNELVRNQMTIILQLKSENLRLALRDDLRKCQRGGEVG